MSRRGVVWRAGDWHALARLGGARQGYVLARMSPPADESCVAPMDAVDGRHVGRRRTKSTSPGVLLFTVTSTLTRHEVEHLVAGKTGGVLQGYRHVPVVP